MSRTSNSLRNAGTALGGQMLNNLMRFVCRTVFIYTLGKEYLGISSLYANVLTILNIGELGFSSAVTYSLYDPLARDNQPLIRSIMAYLKKAYRIIGLCVLAVGLALMPVLPSLMTGVTDRVDIYGYYLLYLTETVVSYLFFSYKSVLLVADQKKYAVDLTKYACQIVMNLVQIGVLLLWKSFFIYTVVSIANHIITNLVTAVLVDRRYPYLLKPAEKLTPAQKKSIFSRVYAAALYKISTAVGTATDNLIISSVISVVAVGLYNNYCLIVGIIQKILSGIFQALSSSLGNLYALESREKNAAMFWNLNLLNNYLVCTCSVCFLTLFQPFVRIWAGEAYLLPFPVVVVIVLNFATNYQQNVVQICCNASGVFVRGKYRAVANAVLNLGISIVLARQLGIAGVLLGSVISRLLTSWWFDPWLLCKAGLGQSPWPYFRDCGVMLAVVVLCFGAVELLFRGTHSPVWLIPMGIVSAALPTGAYLLIYGRTEEFRFLRGKAVSLLKGK